MSTENAGAAPKKSNAMLIAIIVAVTLAIAAACVVVMNARLDKKKDQKDPSDQTEE